MTRYALNVFMMPGVTIAPDKVKTGMSYEWTTQSDFRNFARHGRRTGKNRSRPHGDFHERAET
jgi:hypothetical protein